MKRIAVFSNLFPSSLRPNRATFNRQQFERLAQIYQLQALVPVQWTEWVADKEKPQAVVDTIPTHYFPYFYPPKLGRRFYGGSMLLSSLQQWRQLKNFKPDLLLASWAYPDGVAAARLAKWLKIPYLIKVHGSDVNMHSESPSRARQIVKAMAQASAVVCVSRALTERLESLGVAREKLHVIYNGVDQVLFHPQSRDQACHALSLPTDPPHRLLFVGNVLASKGTFELVAAFQTLIQTRPHTELVIAGDGADLAKVRQQIEAAGLGEQVRLLGRIDHHKLPQWMNCASAVILPSHNEGVPNVLLEAMACGTPVVATAVGGIPEVVPEHCGLLVAPQNSDQLAGALEQCLNQEWDRDAISRHGQSFNWDDNLTQLEQLIEQALAGC